MEKTSKKKKKRALPKRLNAVLYVYAEPANSAYARTFGKKHFGSFSSYIDILIKTDRKFHITEKIIAAANKKSGHAVT